MNAEIIAVGDELTTGQVLDTNTQWLAQRLQQLGIRVVYHTTVGDQLEPAAEVFRIATGRADVVISTGGLGPTADDLTRQAIAEATGRKLVLDEAALAQIRRLYARRGRPMPKQNQRQAMFPQGSRPLANPHGTAPGIALEVPRDGAGPCRLLALPGVPAEMHEMWEQEVSDLLRGAGAGGRIIRHRLIKCFGAGESNIEAMLPDLIRRGREPQVGINASEATIILRITAEGTSEEQCQAAIEPTAAAIRQGLGTLVFGEGHEELEHAVLRLLEQHGKTLATAEWGTAGRVAERLGQVPGAEAHWLGGVVASDGPNIHRALGVPCRSAEGPTAEAGLVEAMAQACRRRFAADYAVAVGQLGQFDPAVEEPLAVFLAVAGPKGVRSKSVSLAGHPAMLKTLCAKHALNLVRLELLGCFEGILRSAQDDTPSSF